MSRAHQLARLSDFTAIPNSAQWERIVTFLAGRVAQGEMSRGTFAALVGCDRANVDTVALLVGVSLP